MKHIIPRLDFTVFDFETTGFKPRGGAEIIEVGAVRIEDGDITDSFQEFVAPEGDIPEEVQNLTGIEPSDVEGARSVEEVLPDFLDFMEDSVLIAHNTEFDMTFLRYYTDETIDVTTVDTLTICRAIGNFSSNKLDDLVGTFGIDREDAHRAHDDARATAKLFLQLAEKIDSFDDYDRCDIPEPLVERDLELILRSVSGLSSTSREFLTSKFESVDELRGGMEDSQPPAEELSDTEVDHLEDFFRGWDEKDDLYDYIARNGRMTLAKAVNSRFWTPVNWGLNGIGLLMVVGAVIGTRDPEVFYGLIVMAVPFFVSSIGVAYFRGSPRARLKQLLFTCFSFGLAALYFLMG